MAKKLLALFVVFAVIDYCSCTVGVQDGVRSDRPVKIEPQSPVKIEPQRVLTVVRGADGNVVLQCVNSHNVVVTNITWSKNNEPFTDSPPRVTIGNGSVLFTPALPEDDGFYQCGDSTPLHFVAYTSSELLLMLTFEGSGCQTFNETDTPKNVQLKKKLEALIRNSTQNTSCLDEMMLHCKSSSTGTVNAKVKGLQATAVVSDFVSMIASGDIGRITLLGTNITLSIILPVSLLEDDEDGVSSFTAHTSSELLLMLTFEGSGCQTFNETDTPKNVQLKKKLEALIRNSTQNTSCLDEMMLHCKSSSTGTVNAKVKGLQATAVVSDFVSMITSGDIGRITLLGTNITLSIILPVSPVSLLEDDEDGSDTHGEVWLVISLSLVITILLASLTIIITSLRCPRVKKQKEKQSTAQQYLPSPSVLEKILPNIQQTEDNETKKAYISAFSNIYGPTIEEPEHVHYERVLNSQQMHEQGLEIEKLVCKGLQSTECVIGDSRSVADCYENECENPHCPCQIHKRRLTYQCYLHTEVQGGCSATVFNGIKEQFSCDNRGTEYYKKAHGVHMVFPPGVVPEGVTVTIELGILLNGPFDFPNNMKVVSPILWICVVDCPNFQFHKPVSVTLPHFLDLSCDADIALLQPCFMKAGHGMEQSQQLTFHPMTQSEAIYPLQSSSATVKTDHFCYICIATNAPTPAVQSKTRYYFASYVPMSAGECQSWDVVFSISYFLPTCIKAMDEQHLNNHIKHPDTFKFTENNEKLEIDYRNELPGGWHLTLQSSPEVYSSEVDYSQYDSEMLQFMHSEKLYPPRFVLNVSMPYNVRTGTTAVVQFKGADKVLRRELSLQLPTSGRVEHRKNLSQSLPILPDSFREQEHLASACGPFMYQWGNDVHSCQVPTKYTETACSASFQQETPTDKELLDLACEILKCLDENWETLFVHLNLDSSVLTECKASTPSITMRVFRLLCAWKQQNGKNSKFHLATCLQRDPHLYSVVSQLKAGSITNLTPSSSVSSLKSISSCSSTSSSKSQKRSSFADDMVHYIPPAKMTKPEHNPCCSATEH